MPNTTRRKTNMSGFRSSNVRVVIRIVRVSFWVGTGEIMIFQPVYCIDFRLEIEDCPGFVSDLRPYTRLGTPGSSYVTFFVAIVYFWSASHEVSDFFLGRVGKSLTSTVIGGSLGPLPL